MNQAAVSKLEHQSDMYISTLRRFLEAMGARLQIVASFPEGDVCINQFEQVHDGERGPMKVSPPTAGPCKRATDRVCLVPAIQACQGHCVGQSRTLGCVQRMR